MPHLSPFAHLPWPHLKTARRFGAGLVVGLALVAGDKVSAETTDNGAIIPDNPDVATTSPQSNPERQAALATWQAARFGLFLHWGVYSVYGGTYHGKDLWSAEWIQENARIPWAEYSQTAAQWNPTNFNASAWVQLAKQAGMKYIVITAKHHDGFAMYPSKASRYNLMDWSQYRGPDPMSALKAACKKHGLLFGIYYSPLEFRISPNGFGRKEDAEAIANGFRYSSLGPTPYASNADVVKLAQAQIKELAESYQPDIFWFDGTWDMMGNWTEDDARQAERAIRAAAPNCVINNRLGARHADFNTIEGKLPTNAPAGVWEYCWNLGVFWGYNPRNYELKNVNTPEHYIETLVKTASLGGNYLLNVGPDPTGKFHPLAVDYLTKIGQWAHANGECIYGTSGNPLPEKPDWGYLTCRPGKVYLIVKDWPAEGKPLTLPVLKSQPVRAYLLNDADKKPLKVIKQENEWSVVPTGNKPEQPFTVITLETGDLQAAAK
jgi:alpha-L-fucosidase